MRNQPLRKIELARKRMKESLATGKHSPSLATLRKHALAVGEKTGGATVVNPIDRNCRQPGPRRTTLRRAPGRARVVIVFDAEQINAMARGLGRRRAPAEIDRYLGIATDHAVTARKVRGDARADRAEGKAQVNARERWILGRETRALSRRLGYGW